MAKRPGKYAAVIGGLPRLPMVEESRRDLVRAVQDEILNPPDDGYVRPHAAAEADMLREVDENIRFILLKHKRGVGKPTAAEFAREYAELRGIKDRFDEWESSLNLLIEAYQILMAEQFVDDDITSLTLSNGRPVRIQIEPYAVVHDPDTFRNWCMEDPDLARKMQLLWQTANSLMKQRLEEGEPEPPGTRMFAKTKVVLG